MIGLYSEAFPLPLGHTLIFPKEHFSKVHDMNRAYMLAVLDLIRPLTTGVEDPTGVKASTIAIHTGIEAGQEICVFTFTLSPAVGVMEQAGSFNV
jgi:histidine triad (HIT) family protein